MGGFSSRLTRPRSAARPMESRGVSNSHGRWLCVLLVGLPLAMPGCTVPREEAMKVSGEMDEKAIVADVTDWRFRRDARLRDPGGWLTLVGLDWLQEGANRIGSAADNDIRLTGGAAHWGTVTLDGDSVTFMRHPGSDVTVNGEQPAGEIPLTPDNVGEPTEVASGSLSFSVIFRESYALRVKDSQAPTLVAFQGIANYPIQADWRIDARYTPGGPNDHVEIANVLGQLEATPIHGWAEFERDGHRHRLLGVPSESGDSVWFIFADRTNGRETYGAGRFLYSEGLPEAGRLTLDFNKAYNPPCAFTEYSTCPLPPPENRLDLAVTAGEKDFHGAAH